MTLTLRLNRCALALGLTSLALVACDRTLTGPTPVPAASMPVTPDLVCVEQLTTSVTIRGDGFAALPVNTLTERTFLELPEITLNRAQTIDGMPAMSMPSVTIPDDAMDPTASRERWASQMEMSFDVFPELGLTPGLYDVEITNRDGNSGTASGSLLGVPRPTLTRIEPDLLCRDQDNQFTLTGDFFLQLADGSEPTIRVAQGATHTDYMPMSMTDCRALPGMSGTRACRTAVLRIPMGDLAPGNYTVVLTNPAPANCASTDAQQLTIVPRPTLTGVEPDLACVTDGPVTLTLRGTGFLDVDGATPTVTIGVNTYDAVMVDSTCSPVTVMREVVRTCTAITVTVPMGDFPPGTYDVVVTNPLPADCSTTESVTWTVVAEPTLVSVVPTNVCSDGTADTTLTATGTGFLSIDGVGPTVTVGTMSYPGTVDPASCTTLTGVTETVLVCTRLTFTIPAGMYPPGDQMVTVTNPAPAGCVSSASITVRFVARPTITSAVPTRICAGGGTLTINGTGFVAGATVMLGTLPATTVTVMSPMQIVATFGSGLPVGGPYDLVVSNAPGCDATLSGIVNVVVGPQIFFADPPVLYAGINTQVLLYVTGIAGTVASVTIAPAGTGATMAVPFVWSAARPGRVQITVPAGLAAGGYDIHLSDLTACEAFLPNGLQVTSTLTVSVTGVDPPFGWTASDTAVTVLGAAPPPAGEVGFQPVPRMYLNPSMPAAGTVATPLESVTLLSSSRATAVVPTGLPVGTYDLIVVNPDASVGFLMDAFEVVTDAPPTIDTTSPGSVTNATGQVIDVLGANFRTPEVTLRCQPRGGGVITTVMTTESAATATSVRATFDASALTNGAICVVRVTNADGTYGDFSAVSVTSPSANLGAPTAAPDMGTARRALSGASAAATRAARFVYAIGGDGGALTSALASVESMPVDIFGNPSAFFDQRYALTTPHTYAGAVRVGRFLYVVGGHDGTAPLASIERAYVLDPADRTSIVDLEIQVIPTGGLAAGLYYYRVAPLMAAADPRNPGGENLPSEAFPVILPTLAGRGLRVAIVWASVPGATGYRVYRSPMVDDPAGAERLIAEVTGGATLTYTDSGDVAGALAPLPLGSTGQWSVVGSLATARFGHGLTAVADPSGVAGEFNLYAFGGRGAAANLTSIEIIPITVAASGTETVGVVRTAAVALAAGRWQTAAYGVTSDIASRVMSTQPWIYCAGGVTTAPGAMPMADGSTDAFSVLSGGDLGPRVSVDMMTPAAGGFGYAPANNFLHAFGGQGGGATASVVSAELCGPGRTCIGGAADPPDLVNWNNAGVSLTVARVNMGTGLLPGFIYLLGGFDGTAVTRSTEFTNW